MLSPGFPSSAEDSNCLPFQRCFATAFQQRYPWIEVVVLSFHYPYRIDCYEIEGVKVYSFNGRNKGGLKGYFLRERILKVLKNLHSQTCIIGIISFWYGETALVAESFARKNQLEHLCWIMGQDARLTNKYPGKLNLAANKLIALSEFLQDEFFSNHGVRPKYIVEPGLNYEDFNVKSRERNIDVLLVGSLIPLKQPELFIDIIADLKREGKEIKAWIIGEGVLKRSLLKMVALNGLGHSIIFAGSVSYEQVIELMKQSSVLLHTSEYEGFSGVCMEALAAGCSVVSFCRPLKREIPNWYFVNNISEMKKRLRYLLEFKSQLPPNRDFPVKETVERVMELIPVHKEASA